MLAEIQRIWLSHLALRKLALKQCYIERITLWTAFSSSLLIACVSSHNYSWEVWDGISDYCDHLALCCRDARSLLPTLGPDTCDIPNLLPISHIGNPCCGETLKCCFARNWVLSKSGHTFCSPLGSCVKKTNKQTNQPFSTSVLQAQRDAIQVVRDTVGFCRGKGSIHTLSQAISACCLFKLSPVLLSPQALGRNICSERAVMKSTLLPRARPELPSVCSQHPICSLPREENRSSCLRNLFERAGLQLVLFRGYF